ncbi:MAG: hypothetical protein ACKO0V_09670 [bacterium]
MDFQKTLKSTFRLTSRLRQWADRPMSVFGHVVLAFLILAAPCWVFGIARLPAWMFQDSAISTYVHQNLPYKLHSDDFAYIGASRNLARTMENLFVPHNTHICPSWRVLTYIVVQAAGDLNHVPMALGVVTYVGLVLLMLNAGHFAAHESRNMALGLVVMCLTGVTAVQWQSTVWYSAGQTFWAGNFILISLIISQETLRRGWLWPWPVVCLCCWVAGGFWTIGHAAGPVTAIYILAAARGRQRYFAILPMVATVFAVVSVLSLGGSAIDSTVSFHGRELKEAVDPVRGLVNSAHAVIETMILANLGIESITTDIQAGSLLVMLILVWLGWHIKTGRPVNALEWTGGAIFVSAYVVEWTFRGYLSWPALKHILPWYDTIPQPGWLFFLAGWYQSAFMADSNETGSAFGKIRASRSAATLILGLILFQSLVSYPEIDRSLIDLVPPMTEYETSKRMFPIPSLKRLRAVYLWDERVKWQRRQLARLQEAELIARNKGWSVQDVNAALGRVRLPMIPQYYDAAFMMDIPSRSAQPADPAEVRRLLEPLVLLPPEPKPKWLEGTPAAWPPKGWETRE